MILGFLKGLLIKALVAGAAFGVVKFGPPMYAKHVGPLPPAIADIHKYTDLDGITKHYDDIKKTMGIAGNAMTR